MPQTVESPLPAGSFAPRGDSGRAAPINVFVHLARDKDVEDWQRAFTAGTLVGVNDETPYGYGRAERMGCKVTFSRSGRESGLAKLVRLGIRVITGFDYLHARRQGKPLAEADVVWTHTESQFLAVAAVFLGKRRRPKLLGQSVWLFDRWPSLSPFHRAAYRRLIRDVDLLTVLSDQNLAVARNLFPDKSAVFVAFGIPSETMTPPSPRPAAPIRVLALGSDRHRDWLTLIQAVRGRDDVTLVILSGSVDPAMACGAANIRIDRARTNAELKTELSAATLVCVPLKPNKHASGITVVQEAVLAGVPVVSTDIGGLRAYFGPDLVRYIPPGDVAALRAAIYATAQDPEAACAMARRAQARMSDSSMGAEAYIQRHVELSRGMLSR